MAFPRRLCLLSMLVLLVGEPAPASATPCNPPVPGAQLVCGCDCDDYWTYGVDGPPWPGGGTVFVSIATPADCDAVRAGYNETRTLTIDGLSLFCPQSQGCEVDCDVPTSTCVRRSCDQVSLPGGGAPECGEFADGCGGTLVCGTCPSGRVCASGVCSSCAPRTCEAAVVSCGEIDDGCGGKLSCGECPQGYCDTTAGRCVTCDDSTGPTGRSGTFPWARRLEFYAPPAITDFFCKMVFPLVPALDVVFSLGEETPKIGIDYQQTSMLSEVGEPVCKARSSALADTTATAYLCGLSVQLKGTNKLSTTVQSCSECVEGAIVCTDMSCRTQKSDSALSGALQRSISQKKKLFELLLGAKKPESKVFKWIYANADELIEVDIKGTFLVSGQNKTVAEVAAPGSCNPCPGCSTEGGGTSNKLGVKVRAGVSLTLLSVEQEVGDVKVTWADMKIGAGFTASAALGAGIDWERRTGECPNRDCRYYYGQGEIGAALDVKGSAKSWIAGEVAFGGTLGLTCSAKVGFDTCRQGGLRVDPDCKVNEASYGDLP